MAASSIAKAKPWVVFDMDGVLVDVHGSYRRAIQRTVVHFGGQEPTPAEVQEIKNLGGYNNDWDVTRELLRRRGLEVPYAEIPPAFDTFYIGRRNGGVWEGLIASERWLLAPAKLAQLAALYQLAIFTGRPREHAEYVLRRFQTASAFARLLVMEDVVQGKPHPEGLDRLRAEFAPAPIAAYIGDTIDDARCAASSGTRFIGILPRTHSTHHELRALFAGTGCQEIVEDVNQAADWLCRAAGQPQTIPAGS